MQYLEVTTKINGTPQTYTLVLHYKRMKNIVFRVSEDTPNSFNVSVPYGMRLSQVETIFLHNLPSLIKLEAKAKTVPFSDKTYLFGNYLPLSEIQNALSVKQEITSLEVYYKVSKKILLNVIKAEVTYYSARMQIPPLYKVRIRSMKTRWATNSKQTMTLTFNEKLIHYHIDIIRALVVHELVHHFISGHGKDFYRYCEDYFPNYRQFDKMLKEHNYAGNYKSK